jgi:hypothetical protein
MRSALQSLSSAAQSQRPHAAIKWRWCAGALAAAASALACSLATGVDPIVFWAGARAGREQRGAMSAGGCSRAGKHAHLQPGRVADDHLAAGCHAPPLSFT